MLCGPRKADLHVLHRGPHADLSEPRCLQPLQARLATIISVFAFAPPVRHSLIISMAA